MRELSLHILDLIQNAIEAKATEVILTIEEEAAQNSFLFSVTDNGRGMDETIVKQVLDPFVTTRSTRKVGLGLPLIEMSTRLAGGSLVIRSKCGEGTTVTAKYQYHHLDRPPLGNIKDTLLTILVANPELSFYFTHRVGERCFELSSREIAGILGGISLVQPEVLAWLTRYLADQYTRLYGGVKHENP